MEKVVMERASVGRDPVLVKDMPSPVAPKIFARAASAETHDPKNGISKNAKSNNLSENYFVCSGHALSRIASTGLFWRG